MHSHRIWEKNMKSRRDWILFVGRFIILGVIAVVGLDWMYGKLHWEWQKRHFVCSHPDYSRLARGMTIMEVEEILGEPTKVIRADDKTQNFYCASFGVPKPIYPPDTQCLRYEEYDGWLGDIDAYFDKDGILLGAGCGTG